MDDKENEAKLEDVAMSWCLKNNIRIYAVPIGYNKVCIEYKQGLNPPKRGEIEYKAKDLKLKDPKWWVKIRKMYVQIYKKNKEKNSKQNRSRKEEEDS